MDSTKLLKFERLAEKRVNDAIKRLRLLGNLANRSNYEYTDAHIQQMLKALKAEMRNLEDRFRRRESNGNTGFQFTLPHRELAGGNSNE